MQYFFINKEQVVCGSCVDSLWPETKREMIEAGLTQVDDGEYEIVHFLQRHRLDEILRLAGKWGFVKESSAEDKPTTNVDAG